VSESIMRVTLKDYFSPETVSIDFASNQPVLQSGCETEPSEGLENKNGFFAKLGERTIGLFVANQSPFLMLDEQAYEIEPGNRLATYRREGVNCEVEICFGPVNARLKYKNTRTPVSTPYYSEDEEDADFGLWICNVLNSDERKRIMIDAWEATKQDRTVHRDMA